MEYKELQRKNLAEIMRNNTMRGSYATGGVKCLN